MAFQDRRSRPGQPSQDQEEESLASQESRLATYDGPDRIMSAAEMRTIVESRAKSRVCFKSKFPGLEELTEGFEGGELIALSGISKHGKTLLAQTLTSHFSEQKIGSCWFTFEVPIPLFLRQIPDTVEFYLPQELRPFNTTWLEDRIVEAKLKHNVRAVFVDHLHYLIDIYRGSKNLSVDIGAVVRSVKRAAVKHNIVIFLLCHATKPKDEGKEAKELSAFDIRDSSFVPQEADSTWIIQRRQDKETGEYNSRATLKVCNHRRTGVMEKRILLEKNGPFFEEVISIEEKPKTAKFYQEWAKDQALSGLSGDDSVPF